MKWALVASFENRMEATRFHLMRVPDEVSEGYCPNQVFPHNKVAYVFDEKTQSLFDKASLFVDGGPHTILQNVIWGFNNAVQQVERELFEQATKA